MSTSIVLVNPGDSVELISDGTNYYLVSRSGMSIASTGNGYFDLVIASNAVTPDLFNGLNQKLTLNQATKVTVNNPILTGGGILAGAFFYLYVIQDSTGGRPTPAFGTAFGSDVSAETIDGTPNTRSVYSLKFHDDALWHLDSFLTGKSVT